MTSSFLLTATQGKKKINRQVGLFFNPIQGIKKSAPYKRKVALK